MGSVSSPLIQSSTSREDQGLAMSCTDCHRRGWPFVAVMIMDWAHTCTHTVCRARQFHVADLQVPLRHAVQTPLELFSGEYIQEVDVEVPVCDNGYCHSCGRHRPHWYLDHERSAGPHCLNLEPPSPWAPQSYLCLRVPATIP